MSINYLRKKIEATITNRTPEMERDSKAAMLLAQMGEEQSAFTEWMIGEIDTKGKKGWWNPMCLLRSYNLRGSDPGRERSNRIRGEIRAAVDDSCPFKAGAWNKNHNKEIYWKWLAKHEAAVVEAMKKNAGSPQTTSTFIPSDELPKVDYYRPTKEDVEDAYRQLRNTPNEGKISAIISKMAENLAGKELKKEWMSDVQRMIETNFKSE